MQGPSTFQNHFSTYLPFSVPGSAVSNNEPPPSAWRTQTPILVRPPQNDDLQKKFPSHYAHLIVPNLVKDAYNNVSETVKTVQQVTTFNSVKDHQLVILDDDTKRLGSLAIATLATVGLKQRILGVGEYMGFMSWLAAMAATPKLINSLVKYKTGINLNQMYDSTEGQRQSLFKDPNYLPLHLLSEDTINRLADQYHIPPGPERRKQAEEKIRQISVQARTWMLLVAGPATPVVSGLICDNLQDWGVRLVNQLQMKLDSALARSAKREKNPTVLLKRVHAYLDRIIGERPEALLSAWWKDFDRGILNVTGLGHHLSVTDVVDSDRAQLAERIAKYLGDTGPLKLEQVDHTLKYLERQYRYSTEGKIALGKLESLKKKADAFLVEFKGLLPRGEMEAQKVWVEDRIHNAQSTIGHYRDLFKIIRSSFVDHAGKAHSERIYNVTDRVKEWMRDTNSQVVTDLLGTGQLAEAEKMMGQENPKLLKKIMQAKGTQRAGELLGATPESHLLNALKDLKLGSLWRRRMVGYLGGGLLLATLLYTTFFIGKDFRKAPPPSGDQS
jgi:hypothetical protein